VLGEPDEVIHWEVMGSFKEGSFWPQYSGGPWYFELPGLPFLGYLLSFVVPGKFAPLRAGSLLGYWSLAIGFYLWGKWRFGKRVGILSSTLWLLSPLAIFYARVGVLETSSVSFAFLSLFSLDYAAASNSKRWALLSGIFLALALYVKYSVFLFVVAYGIVLVLDTIKRNLPDFNRKLYLSLEPSLFLALATCFLLVFPVFCILRHHDPGLFKLHFLTSLGFIHNEIRELSSGVTLWSYGKDVVWWLSPPMVVLSVLGASLLVLRKGKSGTRGGLDVLYPVTFLLVLVALLRQKPFYPRYMLMVVPFGVVMSSLGIASFWVWLEKRLTDTSKMYLGFIGALCGVAFFLNFTFPAFQSTTTDLIERSVEYVQQDETWEEPWVVTNFWPHFFAEATAEGRVTWLSGDIRDTAVYAPDVSKNSLEIFYQEGGFALLEERYSEFRSLVIPEVREFAWEHVRARLKPVVVIETEVPNFPYFREEGNRIEVYKFEVH